MKMSALIVGLSVLGLCGMAIGQATSPVTPATPAQPATPTSPVTPVTPAPTDKTKESAPKDQAKESLLYFSMKTSKGEIVLELNNEKAPLSTANFKQYAEAKHYDGTIFHRVIDGFMIQGGGFTPDMKQKKTNDTIKNEWKNGLKNTRGTIAMARLGDRSPNPKTVDSATSQFFVNVKDNAFLDPTVIPPGDPVPRFEYQGRVYENVPRANLVNNPQLFGYTVFGKVISGMEVITKMKSTPTGPGGPFPTDVPKTPLLINSATLVK